MSFLSFLIIPTLHVLLLLWPVLLMTDWTGMISSTCFLQCEGVGKDSIPGAIDFNVVDDMMQVTDKQSFTVSLVVRC